MDDNGQTKYYKCSVIALLNYLENVVNCWIVL